MSDALITVVIADDSSGVRRAFTDLVQSDSRMAVVGEAANGREAVSTVIAKRPDVVLMDIEMPLMSGLDAAREILEALDQVRIIMVTTFDLDEYVYEALRIGVSGFLLKNAPADELLRGIATVHQGNAMLAPEITSRLMARFSVRRQPDPSPFANGVLTPREHEVTVLVARGLSNAEIAAELYVSRETAKTYVSRILVKLGLRDRTQLAVRAHEAGLLRTGR
ncbi:DNA-binding NarL/FixJ family response regulator [Microbacterium sp. ZKA21]